MALRATSTDGWSRTWNCGLLQLHARSGLVATLLCLWLPTAHAQQRFDLPVNAEVTQPIYLHPADHPIANAILFPGNSGFVATLRSNFLIRVADEFAAAGITAAVVDAPSDHPAGMDRSFRAGAEHATGIAAIAAFLHGRAPAPVWLIGTSNGSISAANAAARLGPPLIAGLVLTSSVWSNGMRQVDLAAIRVPTLIVHNRNDACASSPFSQAAPALNALAAAPAKHIVAVESSSGWGAPCEARSPHGYLGIETQVVRLIVGWIRSH